VRPITCGTGVSGHAPREELQNVRMIGREACPVTHDRTRPIIEGAYWTLTGRGHCRVRSLREARPVIARGASGRCFAGARFSAIGESDHLKRRVQSFDGCVRSLPRARPVIGLTVGVSDRWRIERG
jgi:hypothetical protein